MPLAYENVLGSGAVVVFSQRRDMIEVNHQNIQFFSHESCGKCTPCREGIEVLLEIFSRLVKGEGREEDLPALESLASAMMNGSLCGLGQSAPIPILDSLHFFKQEFDQRLAQSHFLRTLKPLNRI
jgi:NADH:ubiquinone oxidoreductase subunit F (NADH-binding)